MTTVAITAAVLAATKTNEKNNNNKQTTNKQNAIITYILSSIMVYLLNSTLYELVATITIIGPLNRSIKNIETETAFILSDSRHKTTTPLTQYLSPLIAVHCF